MLVELLGPLGIALLVATWTFEGFDLKFLDQIVDEHRIVTKFFTWLVMIISSVAAGFFMVIDAFTGGSVLALCLAMIVAGKIDARLWVAQIALVLSSYVGILIVSVQAWPFIVASWVDVLVSFVIVVVFSIVDELLHELASRAGARMSKVLVAVGEWRAVMKVVVIAMAFLLPYVEWYHAVAWILFDITYELTNWHYTRSVGKARNEQEAT